MAKKTASSTGDGDATKATPSVKVLKSCPAKFSHRSQSYELAKIDEQSLMILAKDPSFKHIVIA